MYRRLGDREVDALASPYQAYALPMKPYYPASARQAGMVLSVSVNGGKPLRLIFDSGAKGILIRAKAAENLGLEFVGDSLVRGPGSGPPAAARVALARSLQIDELRIRNFLLEVTDSIPAGDADGVIGARMFQRFLIRFDAPQRLLELLPFPNGEAAAQTHALQVGHLLLAPARVNGERFGYFMLDTGAAFSALSLDLARSRGQVAAPMYGLGGRVGDAVRISPVQFHFAGEPLTDVEPIAFDLGGISRQEGVEISGLIGYPALSRGVLTINYRDGLVDISPDFRAATRR
jgi:predicted aspartyl protease